LRVQIYIVFLLLQYVFTKKITAAKIKKALQTNGKLFIGLTTKPTTPGVA